jgi:hypothetical protein
VRSDSGWNKWLRGVAARAFAAAVRAHEPLREALPIFLPVESEIAGGFWKPLALEVLASLGDQRCLRDDGGEWRTPAELRLQPEGAGAGLLSSAELHAACGVSFLEPELAAALALTGSANARMLGYVFGFIAALQSSWEAFLFWYRKPPSQYRTRAGH